MGLGIGATVLGGLGIALGIGSSIASAIQARRAAREQRKKEGMIEQQAAEDKALFNKQYYQDITKRTDIQNLMRMYAENQKKADTRAASQSAITGATPEQRLAAMESNRRTFADAVADMASHASSMRDQYLRDYQNQRNRYYAQRLGMQDQLAGIEQNISNQWANAAVNGMTSGAGLLAYGIGQLTPSSKSYVKTPVAADAYPDNRNEYLPGSEEYMEAIDNGGSVKI